MSLSESCTFPKVSVKSRRALQAALRYDDVGLDFGDVACAWTWTKLYWSGFRHVWIPWCGSPIQVAERLEEQRDDERGDRKMMRALHSASSHLHSAAASGAASLGPALKLGRRWRTTTAAASTPVTPEQRVSLTSTVRRRCRHVIAKSASAVTLESGHARLDRVFDVSARIYLKRQRTKRVLESSHHGPMRKRRITSVKCLVRIMGSACPTGWPCRAPPCCSR